MYCETLTYGQVSTTGGEIVSVPVSLSNPVLLDVSQDGSTFLVASFTGGTTISHTIWSAPILGGSVRYLATGTDAGWSPDGSSVAYSTPGGDIQLVRSDGTGDRKLASVGGIAYSISWSPDGGAIRFTKDDNLWEMSADGSNLKKLLPKWNISSWKCCGKWSPDGTRFYFVSNDQIWAFDEGHWLLRRSEGEPVQLTWGPVHWSSPSASKDGKKIFRVRRCPARRTDPIRLQDQAISAIFDGAFRRQPRLLKRRKVDGIRFVSRRHPVACGPGWKQSRAIERRSNGA